MATAHYRTLSKRIVDRLSADDKDTAFGGRNLLALRTRVHPSDTEGAPGPSRRIRPLQPGHVWPVRRALQGIQGLFTVNVEARITRSNLTITSSRWRHMIDYHLKPHALRARIVHNSLRCIQQSVSFGKHLTLALLFALLHTLPGFVQPADGSFRLRFVEDKSPFQLDWTVSSISPPFAGFRNYFASFWMVDGGRDGWAVGRINNRAGIYRYSPQSGWTQFPLGADVPTEMPLTDIWMNKTGTAGWVVGVKGSILRYDNGKWHYTPISDRLKQYQLNAVWGTEDGLAWAVGSNLSESSGVILHYDESKKWSVHTVGTNIAQARLEGLWFNENGTRGWAVGDRGEILRYDHRHGWHRDPLSRHFAGTTFYAVWMNDTNTAGWAVGGHEGSYGTRANATIIFFETQTGWQQYAVNGPIANTVLWDIHFDKDGQRGLAAGYSVNDQGHHVGAIGIYSAADHWQLYPEATDDTTGRLFSIWLDERGTNGWAIGESRAKARPKPDEIGDVMVTPVNDALISTLEGAFLLSFPADVRQPPSVDFRTTDAGGGGFLTSQHYEIGSRDDSSKEFIVTFRNAYEALPEPGRYMMVVSADMGTASLRSTNVFETVIEIAAKEITWKQQISALSVWLLQSAVVLFVVAVLFNITLLVLALRHRGARAVILHDGFARLWGLKKFGKYFFMDFLIIFVAPIRRGLMADYNEELRSRKLGTPGWNPFTQYISPDVSIDEVGLTTRISGGSEDKGVDGEATIPAWRQAITDVMGTEQNGVWFIVGRSGLGKTALLENCLSVVTEAGMTGFLVRLGTGQSPASQITSLLNQFGHIPWSSTRRQEVEKVEDLLGRGRFVILLDGLNEDPHVDQTQTFIRRMINNNVVIVSSQYRPDWKDLAMRNIRLHAFAERQLKELLPAKWLQSALKEEHLQPVVALPQSAKLLAAYVERYQRLPNSVDAVYEAMYADLLQRSRILNLEEKAWDLFRENIDQFEPSQAVPEQDICAPGVAVGLLTGSVEDGKRKYRFVHNRLLCYVVARFLVRQEEHKMADWHGELKRSVPRSHWDDVIEMWAGMVSDREDDIELRMTKYVAFLKDVGEFRIEVFVERLYPQYTRLWKANKIRRNPEFEQWVLDRLLGAVGKFR